ncbi:MAG: hypothetical protein HND54_11075 [Bacteroidetes bacterium]|nr:hypothetical protein [Bacteroidota bacterium]
MAEQPETYTFGELMQNAGKCQLELFEVYKSSIGLINELKNRSKVYMNMLSDIEDGLLSSNNGENSIESNLARLTKNIQTFNEIIGDKSEAFTEIFDKMHQLYDQAISIFQGAEGELTKLIEARKQLLFLVALIRKYKYKINSLQLMNNALMSLSSDLDKAKDAYKSNLIQLSTAMTSAIEDVDDLVDKIENVN